MKNLEKLTDMEKELLLKFPAYISLLVANNINGTDKQEINAAIRFSHIKTYSCDPLLYEFYREADKVFEKNINQLNDELPKEKDQREVMIRKELTKLENIVLKLGKKYAAVMFKSMRSFKEHVSKAHHNVLESFIFPLPIKGLTD
jgi:hypothetical protein